MKYLILISVFAIGLLSCDDDEQQEYVETCGVSDKLNFELPLIGQNARYLRFTGKQYGQTSGYQRFEYSDDTLVLQIFDSHEDEYLLGEYWTKGSENIPRTDTTFHWLWTDGDSLFLRYFSDGFTFSDFFTAYGLGRWSFGDTLGVPLQVFEETKTEVMGWQLDAAYGENYRQYSIDSWSLFERAYDNLNVIVNNTPMQVDGNGTTYIYSSKDGFVRSVTYGWWTREGVGWDLLP